ncbi:diguanylate cyclase [Candidatus Villigracilis affinis]|uniref:GGDEF domain-containing protein n=1 Tax=Candidatus Villigracilis affinis TaxID=3140682 RepID=UPI001D9C3CA8|nr:diguanylate cyclase [Anaerolineales bacterium]
MQRIRDRVGAYKLDIGSGLVSVTISVGVAEYCPETQALDDLLRNADKAMYAAKESGRNCVSVYPAIDTV